MTEPVSPPSPTARVAIGTHSGVRVSEHFGYATRFEIWEVAPTGSRLLETRLNKPACRSATHQPGTRVGDEGHADELMEASVASVSDCRAVVVAKIGECALTRLDHLGILAFETEDPVDQTVRELAQFPGLFERHVA
ncbi:MAG: NifB/NifX family molybdenum-iron cluster-binding protein [Ancalomicrobiaceae bacterium]|nr:NifB/NifX family molybdenum-iron cluster-binding protein [Ancalomicrobiaceae bacterium]